MLNGLGFFYPTFFICIFYFNCKFAKHREAAGACFLGDWDLHEASVSVARVTYTLSGFCSESALMVLFVLFQYLSEGFLAFFLQAWSPTDDPTCLSLLLPVQPSAASVAAAYLCSAVLHAVVSVHFFLHLNTFRFLLNCIFPRRSVCSPIPSLTSIACVPLSQPRGPGSSSSTLGLIHPSFNLRPVPTCSCPPPARSASLRQSEPHQRPSGESEPSTGRRFPQPGRG